VTIHRSAQAFANVAAAYERGRPAYPGELLDWLVERRDLVPGKHVLDLGAGTGKLTRLLVGRGARVTAVEPVEEMRAELGTLVPQAEVLAGQAEDLPLPDRSIDLVTCGQSFHWFATAPALGEITRVLVPRGVLLLVWNTRDERDPLQAELSRLVEPTRGDTPSESTGAWRSALERSTALLPDGELEVCTGQVVDRAGLLDRVESTSHVAALAGPERAELLAAVASLVPDGVHARLAYVTRAYAFRVKDEMISS
jgi:ubiquinone/menaquinone biosynthesis C-methylase UbiE